MTLLNFTASLKIDKHDYWTSASNHGTGCVKNWWWCSSNTTFTPGATSWANGQPTSTTKQCAQIHLEYDPKKMLLEEMECSEKRFYICEVRKFMEIMISSRIANN
jgi:hypothetical protein